MRMLLRAAPCPDRPPPPDPAVLGRSARAVSAPGRDTHFILSGPLGSIVLVCMYGALLVPRHVEYHSPVPLYHHDRPEANCRICPEGAPCHQSRGSLGELQSVQPSPGLTEDIIWAELNAKYDTWTLYATQQDGTS